MKVTAKVFPVTGSGAIKANASITFDSQFVVTGLKIMEGKSGLFVSMPSVKKADGEWKDTAFPLSKEFRQTIQDTVLKKYLNRESPEAENAPW